MQIDNLVLKVKKFALFHYYLIITYLKTTVFYVLLQRTLKKFTLLLQHQDLRY